MIRYVGYRHTNTGAYIRPEGNVVAEVNDKGDAEGSGSEKTAPSAKAEGTGSANSVPSAMRVVKISYKTLPDISCQYCEHVLRQGTLLCPECNRIIDQDKEQCQAMVDLFSKASERPTVVVSTTIQIAADVDEGKARKHTRHRSEQHRLERKAQHAQIRNIYALVHY